MYNLIRTWVQTLVTALNATLTTAGKDNLREIDTNLDINFLPANLKTHSYIIKLGEIEQGDLEYEIYNGVPVRIEFLFGLYNKDITQYQEYIDTYLIALKNLLKTTNTTSPLPYYNATVTTSCHLKTIKDVKLEDLSKLDNGGKYLVPALTFMLETVDEETVVTVTAPTLASPAEAASTSPTPAFQWGDVTGADNYEIQIATDSGFANLITTQKSLVSSYTIPTDLSLADGTYYWHVKAWQGVVYSAWSTTRSFTAVNPAYEAESTALFARMATQPDTTRKGYINTLIAGLKTDGIWDKLTGLVIPASHAEADSLLNWKADLYNGTAVNAPTFVIDRGYTGNGTTQYIDTGYNVNLSAQDSFSLFFYSRTNNAEVKIEMGIYNANVYETRIAMRIGSSLIFGSNQATANAFTNIDSTGLGMANRISSTQVKGGRNGTVLSTANTNSIPPVSANLFVLGANNGSGALTLGSTKQCAMYGWGTLFTDTDFFNFNIRLRIYLDAIGAGV